MQKDAAALSKRELIERLSLLEQTLASEQDRRAEEREPVSYTHLTLPTSDLV